MSEQAFAFKRFTQALTANQILRIYVGQFNYLLLLSNTGATDTIKVSINGQEFQVLSVGLKMITKEKFEFIDIQNTDSVTATFVLYIGNGDIDNTAFTASATLTVNQTATSIVTSATFTATSASAVAFTPNSACRELHVYNPSTTKTVWYGGSTLAIGAGTPVKGTPILPGEKVVISLSGAIYFQSETSNTDIYINELRGA